MDRFGSDKPDTRFGVELIDLSDIFKESQFKVFRSIADGGGVIKAINAKGAAAALSKEQLKKWEEWVKTELGAKGLAYIRLKDGEWESPIVKFFGEQEKTALAQRMDFQDGDVLFFGADKWEAACETLGRVRLRVADLLQLNAGKSDLNFLWVVDFPLLQFAAEDNRWVAVHHPFTRPHPDDMAALNGVKPSRGACRCHADHGRSRGFETSRRA